MKALKLYQKSLDMYEQLYISDNTVLSKIGYVVNIESIAEIYIQIVRHKIFFKATPHISKKYRIQKKNTRQISRV